MMKNKLNNSKGYALLVVLLIIVVIAIMTPPIISKIMTSSSQYLIVEENLQIDKLGDMGILYTKKSIEKAEMEAKKDAENKAEIAGDAAVNSFLDRFKDNKLPWPSQEEIEQEYQEAYEKEYLFVFKAKFREIMEAFMDSSDPSCNEKDDEEFKTALCKEIKVKDEEYKYKVAYIITDKSDGVNIKFRVYMTVNGKYKTDNMNYIEDGEKTITITFS